MYGKIMFNKSYWLSIIGLQCIQTSAATNAWPVHLLYAKNAW